MKWMGKFQGGGGAWRWVSAVTLVLVLAGAQAASAASSATIMVFAPGAPMGSQVSVEWLDPATNTWVPVTGWTGTFNQTTGTGTPFQAFAVLPANYGQEAFRWVVFNPPSTLPANNPSTIGGTSANNMLANMGSVWGMSSPFTLPNTDGVNLQITVWPAQTLKVINTVVGTNNGQGAANANIPFQNTTAGMIIASLNCPTGCNAGAITGKFTGLPTNSWITVQWLDSNGVWEPVIGWQGQADFIDASGNLVKQFGVYQQNYGQGPFRWAVYNAPTGGSLLAISPNFNLPTSNGQNEILNLAG